MNRINGTVLFFIFFFFIGTGICYSDDGPEVSEAIKVKYTPLVEAFQKSFDNGDYTNALGQIQNIVKSAEKEKELVPTHPAIIQLNAMIAMTYMKLKKNNEAEAILTELNSRLEKNNLADSESMLILQETIRDLYKETGNKAKADSADVKVKKLREKHPEWAGNDVKQESFDKYKPMFQKAHEMSDSDPKQAISMAIETMQQAEKELGSDHPVTVQAYINLSQLYMKTEDYTNAESTLDKAGSNLEISKKTSTMDMIFILKNYQDLYKMQGKEDKAISIESKIKDIVSKDASLRKRYDEEQKKQAEKMKEMGKDGDKKNFQDSKNKLYYDEMEKINQIAKFGNPDDGIKSLESLRKKAQGDLQPNDQFFKDIDRNMQDFYIRMYIDQKMPEKALEISKKRISELEANAKQDLPALSDAYRTMGLILENTDKQQDATAFYEKAYQTIKKAMDFSKDEKSISNNSRMLFNIGRELLNYYDRRGRYSDAATLIKEQIDLLNKYQPDDMRTLDLMLSLAQIYERSKTTSGLEDLYSRMSKLLDKVQANPPVENETDKKKGFSVQAQLARFNMQIGQYYSNNGKTKEAQNYFDKARKLSETSTDNIESLRILSHIANSYFNSGMQKEAEQILTKLMPLFEKHPEMKKNDLAEFYFLLGRFYSNNKKGAETQKYYELAIATFIQDEKKDNSRIINVMQELKNYYESQGKNEDAVKVLDRMQELRKNNPNPDKAGDGVEIVRIYSQKANNLRNQGKNADAEKTIDEMIDTAKSKYGEKSREYAIAMIEKANYYNPEANTKVDIDALYQGAIDILDTKAGNTWELADALSSFGRMILNKGNDNERAISLLKRAVSLVDQPGKQGNPQYAISDLAFAYVKSGKNSDEAEKLFKKAIDMNNRNQKPDDFWMTGLLINLGQLYFNRGTYAEAEKIWKQDEELMIKTAKNDKDFRPDFNSLYNSLIQLYEKTGNTNEMKKYQNKQKDLSKG